MSDEQVGKYIRLLCLQHQKGYLCEKDMIKICKSYDEDIFSKFIKEEEMYYNKRLSEETEKRKLYSESRKNNRKSKDMINISKTYVQHMENENENIIENKKVVRFQKPTIEDVKTYMKEQGMNDISERWMSHYESNGWLVGKNKMKDWKASVRTWKLNNLQTEEIKTNKPKIATL